VKIDTQVAAQGQVCGQRERLHRVCSSSSSQGMQRWVGGRT
jgi:hypothetical protein